ncbi:MAG: hypothetical protein NWF03_08815 [Candidatus Bathyarchaeota archaeon]|nr:hypothetical protein [Candidatus Bathyarchaeota archaeon]
MGEAIMNIVEKYTKNKLIAYFLMLWAATFFLSCISGFLWLAGGHEQSILDTLVDVLWNFADLGCAAVLAMLGLKFLNQEEKVQEE